MSGTQFYSKEENLLMSGPEIREKILQNNKLITEREDITTFILNTRIRGKRTRGELP